MTDKHKVEIEIEVDQSDVLNWAAEAIADKIRESAEWEHRIRDRVEKLVDDITAERVSARVDAILDRGFRKTDRMGLPVGSFRDPVMVSFEDWFSDLMQREARKRVGVVEVAVMREIQRQTQVDVDSLRMQIRDTAKEQLRETVKVEIKGVVQDVFGANTIPYKEP